MGLGGITSGVGRSLPMASRLYGPDATRRPLSQLLFDRGAIAGAFCNSRAMPWLACGAHVSHQRRDTVPVLRIKSSCARSSQSAVQ